MFLRHRTFLLLFTMISFSASSNNLSADKDFHEQLVAIQSILTLGCVGKLNIPLNEQTKYNATNLDRLSSCVDNASTDIASDIAVNIDKGTLTPLQIPNFFMHNAVIFSKRYSSEARDYSTEKLIRESIEEGKKRHPYVQ